VPEEKYHDTFDVSTFSSRAFFLAAAVDIKVREVVVTAAALVLGGHCCNTYRFITLNSNTVNMLSSYSRKALFRLGARQHHPLLVPRASHKFSAVPLLQEQEVERPRLEALRERLAQEEQKGGMMKLNSKNMRKSSSSSNSNKEEQAILNKQKEEPTVYEILKQLEHTPPIPSSQVLQDSFQRQHSYLRISLVERCNLRCRYCMPPEGVPLQPFDSLLSRNEILTLATLFHKHGVDKIRLTGGEPLLRKDLVDIVSDLSSLSNISQIGMTTNGVTLKRHLPLLVNAGLTHVNISLDSLREDVFQDLTRRKGLQQVLASIEEACKLLPPGRVKLNVVVMKGVNDEELQDFCELTRHYPLDVRFIEWMPFSDNGWNQGRFVSYESMLESLSPLKLDRAEDGPNDTTKWWKLPNNSKSGRIGFITSMSQHFCGTCNRLRLTADGKLKACLFGSSELSLRDALREGCNEESLEKLIHYAVQRKTFALGGHGSAQGIAEANDNRPMTLIGG